MFPVPIKIHLSVGLIGACNVVLVFFNRLQDSNRTDKWLDSQLSPDELKSVKEWQKYFHQKYVIKGRLKEYADAGPTENPPPAQGKPATAAAAAAADTGTPDSTNPPTTKSVAK